MNLSRKTFLKMGGLTIAGLTLVPFLKPFAHMNMSANASSVLNPDDETASVSTFMSNQVRVFEPDAKPYGVPMSSYAAKWWQWIASVKGNVFEDSVLLENSQPPFSKVFYMTAGYNNEHVTKEVSVPQGKAIFMPVLNSYWALGESLDVDGRKATQLLDTEDKLKEFVRQDMDLTKSVSVTINNEGIPYYRIESSLFSLPAVEGNPMNITSTKTKAFTDGYWIFLKPLPVGTYTLKVRGVGTNWHGNKFTAQPYAAEGVNIIRIV